MHIDLLLDDDLLVIKLVAIIEVVILVIVVIFPFDGLILLVVVISVLSVFVGEVADARRLKPTNCMLLNSVDVAICVDQLLLLQLVHLERQVVLLRLRALTVDIVIVIIGVSVHQGVHR